MSQDAKTTERAPDPTPREHRSVTATALLWLARLVVAGLLGWHGFQKLAGGSAEVALFTRLDMEPVGRYVIGSLELLAAGAVLLPQSTVYGALLGLSVMLGAIMGHLTVIGLAGIQFAVLVAAACVAILYLRRFDADFLRNLWDR